MTPQTPYYAVIFTSILKEESQGYQEMANRMIELAKEQDGFLGIESARQEMGISVSYWQTLEDIKTWKQNTEHILAQEKGKSDWYSYYKTRICRVEREYEFTI